MSIKQNWNNLSRGGKAVVLGLAATAALSIPAVNLYERSQAESKQSLEERTHGEPSQLPWQKHFDPEKDQYWIQFEESAHLPIQQRISFKPGEFIYENTTDKLSAEQSLAIVTEVIVGLQGQYRQELDALGRTKFRPYEILQILQKIDKESRWKKDVTEINAQEAYDALKLYNEKGKEAFPLDLVKIPQFAFGKEIHGPTDYEGLRQLEKRLLETRWQISGELIDHAREAQKVAKQVFERNYQHTQATDTKYQRMLHERGRR